MKVNSSWVIGVGLAAAAALLLSLYQLLGWTGPVISLASILGLIAVYFAKRLFYVYIGELEYGVVFRRRSGNFSRFLDPGPHLLNPFTERLSPDRITRKSQTAKATTKVRTKEGIVVEITWAVSFKVNVHFIKKVIRHKLARTLPKSADKVVAGKTIQSLRHIVEQKSVVALYRRDATKELEHQLCDQVNARLQLRHTQALSDNGVSPIPPRNEDESISGLGIEDIPWRDVQVFAIEMPPEVERALKVDNQRRLETMTTVNALNRLQTAVANFSDTDIERLAQLERMRILDKDGKSLTYLLANLS